jgi:folylpolyglutamate synthase/dihydropteroate synthase
VFEHPKILGDTIGQIAYEKACLGQERLADHPLSEQSEDALPVFRAEAEKKSVSLFYLSNIFRVDDIKLSPAATSFWLICSRGDIIASRSIYQLR